MMMTDQVHEYVLENRWQRNRRIRKMWPDTMPVDKTWQLVLLAVALTAINAVLVVRWALCI